MSLFSYIIPVCLAPPSVSNSVGLGRGSIICICDRLPGEDAAAGPHFENQGPIAVGMAIVSVWFLRLPPTPLVLVYTSETPFLVLLGQGMVLTHSSAVS